jgi:RNA polymerase sigma-70 factor (ECF subfamily)
VRAAQRDGAWLTTRPAITDPQADAAGREFESRLQAHIAELPDKLRSVLLLSAMEELDTAAIAAVLKIPEGTVRSRLHAARRQLMRTLWP